MLLKKILFLFLLLSYLTICSQVEVKKFYNNQNGLTSENITQISQDNIGYLWIGTTKGLFKFDGNDFLKINNENITFLSVKGDKIYIGTDKRLIIKERRTEEFFESKTIKEILFHGKKVFIATKQGVSELKENYIQPLSISTTIDFSIINDLIFFEDYYYVASNKGLFKIDNLNNPKEIKILNRNNCVDLEIFDKRIIVATNNDGLKIINKKNKESFLIKSSKYLTGIKKFKNQLWVNSETDAIEIYSLPSFSFIKRINKYNTITTNYVSTGFQDNTGDIWIGTDEGLYEFSSGSTTDLEPTVHFELFEVNYKDKSHFLDRISSINLSTNDNSVVVNYKSVNLNKPNSIEYRYVLNKFKSKWTKNNVIQLVNLNYGKYKLQVQSRINNQESQLKSLDFSIETPLYYNVYFLITSFVVLVVIAYFIVILYVRKIKKKNELKVIHLNTENKLLSLKQKALQLQMNPHFIFNVLNNIKALGNSGKVDELNESINQFSNLLRSILHNSAKEQISLKDELISIENYLSLEKLISNKSFDYIINVNIAQVDTEEVLVPSMLFQPFIENSIKHGFSANKKGLIKVLIESKNKFLHIEITDNGVGFNPVKSNKSDLSNSLALKITKQRLEKINKYNNFEIGKIIQEKEVIGTKVRFKLPLVLDY